MMKKSMLKLDGAKVLNKAAQKEIGGGGVLSGCTQNGFMCCQQRQNGPVICDPGKCMPSGWCLFF